jgi:large repetitive protein
MSTEGKSVQRVNGLIKKMKRSSGRRPRARILCAVAAVETLEGRRLLSVVGGFSPPVVSEIGKGQGAAFAVAVVDVLGDGNPELIVANDNGTISILPGYRNGTFGPAETVSDGLPDGSGSPQDLAVAKHGGQIFVTNDNADGTVSFLTKNGYGIFSVTQELDCSNNGAEVNALATASFNVGSINFDVLATADGDGESALCFKVLGKSFLTPGLYSVSNEPLTSVVAGRFYPNTYTSFVFMNSGGSVSQMTLDSYGNTGVNSVNSAGGHAAAIGAVDLTGDGLDDLVVANQNGSVTTLQGGSDGFELASTTPVSASPFQNVSLQTGDVVGDGSQEVLLTQPEAGGAQSTALFSDGRGGLYGPVQIASGAVTALADVNQDGRADLISCYYSASTGIGSVGVQLGGFENSPSIASQNAADFVVGSFGTFTITTDGYPAVAVSESGGLPDGLTFQDNGNGTATISGIPDGTSLGTYPLLITASNGVGADAVQTLTLTVDNPAPPVITSGGSAAFVVGQWSSFSITSTSGSVDSLSYTGTLPEGLFFEGDGVGTATICGTPAAATAGTYNLTITASSAYGQSTQALVLTVNEGTIPVISITVSGQLDFTVGRAGTFLIAGGGVGTSFSTTSALPAGLRLVNLAYGVASLGGVPSEGAEGSYVVTITASDLGAAVSRSFALTVVEGSVSPTLSGLTNVTMQAGSVASYQVTAGGTPLPVITESGTLPDGLSFSDASGTGTVTGTLTANSVGVYTETFTATSSAGADSMTMIFTVEQNPAFNSPDSGTLIVGAGGSVNVSTSGFAAPSLQQTGTLPGGIIFTDNGDGTGTFSGTATAGSGGVYPETITASDSNGTSISESFSLIVDASPAITSASTANFAVGTNGSFAITTGGFPAAAVSLTSGTLPSGLTFTANANGTATISGDPASGTAGNYTLTLSAANSLAAVTGQLIVEVEQPVEFKGATTAQFAVGKVNSFSITTSPSSSNVALTEMGKLPAGITFVDNGNGTARLSGTPTAADEGTFNFTITASNSFGVASEPMELTIGAAKAVSFTSSARATFTSGTSGSFTITTAGFPEATFIETGALPQGLIFQDNLNGTATISGTPQLASGQTVGTYTIHLTASNGITTAKQTLVVAVVEIKAKVTTAVVTGR